MQFYGMLLKSKEMGVGLEVVGVGAVSLHIVYERINDHCYYQCPFP